MIEFEGRIEKITDYVWESDRAVKVLQISTENAPGFVFEPGQFVMISAGGVKNPHDPSRLKFSSMSIASAPHQKGIVELCIKMKEEPGVSNYLKKNAKMGAPIKIKGPFGAFKLEKEQSSVLFIATGTGIAPIMSMLRHLLFTKFMGKIWLFYGCRCSKDFLYHKELTELEKMHENFELHYSFSREEIRGKKGHIQKIVKEYDFPENKKGIQAYSCGNPNSVKEQVETLKSKGFEEENIHHEKW